MALAGVGVDILEIARMQRAIETNRRFLERVFTAEERAYCDKSARPAENYAARFAAREAILKALGIEGDYEGIGHLILGYPASPAQAPAPRKADYVFYVR